MRKPPVIALVAGIVAGLAGLGVMPREPRLTAQTTGDANLAAEVRAAVADPGGYRGLSVALIDGGQVRTAGLGDRDRDGNPVEADTPFEIGSVPKVLTGMLLAHQASAGAVRPDDTLGATWPEVTGPAHEVTLAELASHRTGLPRVPLGSVRDWVRVLWANFAAGNPYAGQDVDRVRAATDDHRPGDDRGRVGYSNLGMALLGQALAANAGTGYPELLDRELLTPLGMTATVQVTDPDAVPAGRAEGARSSGRTPDPWIGAGYAPAGIGYWSTAADLARLVSATAAGTAPGVDAREPRFDDTERTRIGYGWFTTRYGDREITWHNGATSGFHSYIGFDRATGNGVVVLGNTDKGVEPIGLRLLGVPREQAGTASPALPTWAGAGIALLFTFIGGLSLLGTVLRPTLDRLTALAAAVWALVYPALGHQLGDWSAVPGWLWPVGLAASGAGLALAVHRWRELPVNGATVPWRRVASVTASSAAAVALTAALLS
ncbi:serine hydrolase domain-containing protein [Micromonospora sp. WMMD1082]|uniref:serine hydrolase domain-containing protein n=1 Tax=Micromonospora sp. WMMD1082 TaxID=3016104 RepID=UPI002416CA78|nr:serine hydrolase domain-containing protein [Micromonospora sp. WMMD1082]MDG4792933.1 serine hydrolase [Micromonospora sp. WMMD1082]